MLIVAALLSWPLPSSAHSLPAFAAPASRTRAPAWRDQGDRVQAFVAVHATGLAFGRRKILRQHVKKLNPSLFAPKGGKVPKARDAKLPPVRQDSAGPDPGRTPAGKPDAGKTPPTKDFKPPPVRQDSGGKPTAAQARAPQFKPFTKDNFRENLGRLTGGIPRDAHAHHVLPKEFVDKFQEAGINIHDPRYGAWWRASTHQKNARTYNNEWREFLYRKPEPPSREQILQFGRKMAKDHGLQIHF